MSPMVVYTDTNNYGGTTSRDFGVEAMDRTRSNESHRLESAYTRRGPGSHRRRRSSVVSSYAASLDDTGLHQRTTKTNTVKTYRVPEHPIWQPGAEPGVDTTRDEDEPRLLALHQECDIHITDYSEDVIGTQYATNDTLKDVLEEERPDNLPCRWISVNGLSWDVIKTLANKYNLHRLAVEDMINTRSRTKVDWYSDNAFAIMTLQKLVRICDHPESARCGCDPDSEEEDSSLEDEKEAARYEQQRQQGAWHWLLNTWRNKEQDAGIEIPEYSYNSAPDTVKVHDSLSPDSPVKHIRTLHRYQGSQSPEYIAFMERHSVLARESMVVAVEQVSIFLTADNTVISFFEHSGPDVERPIFERLNSLSTMLRRSCDASLLMEAIIDTIVDLALPIQDAYNKARREMQIDVLTNPDIQTSKSLYIFSEEVDMLQNLFKPIIHLINALRDHQSDPLHKPTGMTPSLSRRPDLKHGRKTPSLNTTSDEFADMPKRQPLYRTQTSTDVTISPLAHTYLGDVLDHCITHIQALEQMDASATNLSDLIFNSVGARTNRFMMILAMVTVFFSPLTFISGYAGMNFHNFDFVQLHSDAYFWLVAGPSVTVFMLVVTGSIIWGSIKNWLLRTTIRKVRHHRDKMRAATYRKFARSQTQERRANEIAAILRRQQEQQKKSKKP